MEHLKEHRKLVEGTGDKSLSTRDSLTVACLGLAGETGELIDALKKHLYHGKALDTGHIILEMGDIFWYLHYLSFALGLTLEEVIERNIDKLKARYPKGFSVEAAKMRADLRGEG